MELKGIGYLRSKLETVRERVKLRYAYYEMKDYHITPSATIPPALANRYAQKLGWCTKAVDQLADRLVVRGFRNDGFGIEDIYNDNNADILFDSAIRGALISACDFIYIAPDDQNDIPRMQVIDGGNATGIINPITNLLHEGYAVLEREAKDPVNGKPTIEAYFEPYKTTYYYAETKTAEVITHTCEYPLLVPIINRPDAVRNFGHSRISRSCMNLQRSAEDVLVRAAVTADFYSFPQKYVLGLSDSAEQLDAWKATVSAMLRFDKDEDGDRPTLGQFQQQSMTPHMDHFKLYASVFAGETGLTLDDLGFVSDNPSSAEAIKASHEALRVTAAEAQRSFSTGFVNAGFVAACLRDNYPYPRSAMYDTSVRWCPVVEPDAAMLSSIGDGAIKINQALDGFLDAEALEDLTGIEQTR